MADLNTDFQLGEYRGDNVKTDVVQFSNGIVAGDVVSITGTNSDGQVIVSKHTGKRKPYGICPRGSNGGSGDIREILIRGPIKVTFGGAVASGLPCGVKDNKFIAKANDSSAEHGISITGTAANNDTGLVFFDLTGVGA